MPPPGNHSSFYCLHSFAFSQMSYSLNHREAFSDWLISLSSVHLRFLHVLAIINRAAVNIVVHDSF